MRTIRRIYSWNIILLLCLAVSPLFGAAEAWAQQPNGRPSQDGERSRSNAQPSGGSGGQISETELVGLPLNGRSYSQLATLQSGISDTSSGTSSARGVGGGGLTVSGGRSSSNTFLMDGTMIMNSNNEVPRSAAGVQLGSDAVLQVQVLSTTYGAEYGRSSGGVLNSITRSGTPEFHGSLFEYLRNSKLDARNFFDNGPEPTPFKRNQFGFTLTGPLLKDRTFFMGSFEAMRDRLSETDIAYFPDAEARRGIITDKDGKVLRTVPVSEKVKPYLALYPLPNLERLGGGVGKNAATRFLPTNENFFAVRLDHKITDRDSMFIRYTFDDATSDGSLETYLFNRRNDSRQQYLTMVESHIFNPSFLNTVRLGFTRPNNSGESVATVFEVPRSLYFVPNAIVFGQINVSGLSTFGPANNAPEFFVMNSYQAADELVLRRGAHSLHFGGETHRYQWNNWGSLEKGGWWQFNSLDSFLQAGPEGTVLRVALPESNNQKYLRQSLFGFYLQDEYRASPRFQFSMGLRYEFTTLIKDRYNTTAFLIDPVHESQVQVGPYVKEDPSKRNFSPRLGITWAPAGNQSLVLRAGFGIFYDELLQYVVQQRRSSVPFYKIPSRTNFDASTTFPNALAAIAGAPTQYTLRLLDYLGIQSPTVYRYTFSIQQQLAGGWRTQIAYVGARGNHLFRSYEMNLFPQPILNSNGSLCFPPDQAKVIEINPACLPVSSSRAGPINPNFSGIQMLGSDAQSFYNALQLSAGKSVRNFSISANYTYSKSVDDASSSTGGDFQYALMRTLERGLSSFDIRNRLSVNYFVTTPFGGRTSGTLARLLGGWRLGGIISVRSGTPFSPNLSVRKPGYLFAAGRPDLISSNKNPVSGTSAGCKDLATGRTAIEAGRQLGTNDLYFDPCAFGVPAPGMLGTAGNNIMSGPGVFNMDVSLQRDFLLDSKRSLQFRAEFFNLPNHTNFSRPDTLIFSGSSGRRNDTAGRINGTSTPARQIQFALRFSF